MGHLLGFTAQEYHCFVCVVTICRRLKQEFRSELEERRHKLQKEQDEELSRMRNKQEADLRAQEKLMRFVSCISFESFTISDVTSRLLFLCRNREDMERRLQDKHEEVTSLEHKENVRLEQQKAEVLEKKRKEVSNVVVTSQFCSRNVTRK